MNHPLRKGTHVIVAYQSCQNCGPQRIQKVGTRIAGVREDNGTYFYTLLDGREVSEADIIEVK